MPCQCALEAAILALQPRGYASVDFRRLLQEAKNASHRDGRAFELHMALEERYLWPRLPRATRLQLQRDHDRYRELYSAGLVPMAADVTAHAAIEDPLFVAIAKRQR